MLTNYRQAIKTSSKALLANKGRSFLTMLGIIIGVSAVIVINTVGAGAQELILAQIKSIGTDKIAVLPGSSDEKGPPASALGIVITTLTYDDMLALEKKNNVPNANLIAAYSNGNANISWKSNNYNVNFSGTTHQHLEIMNGKMAAGRFFTEEEEKNFSRVIVLGSEIKEELFGDSEAIGKKVKIKKHAFDVIGVTEEQGTVGFENNDNKVFIPLRTAQRIVLGVNHVNKIVIQIDNEANISRAKNDVKATIREQHDIKNKTGKEDDFSVKSSAEGLEMLTSITDALRYFLAAMAALSLLVGGIGIMNIMLVSVSERTNEIGLRKALGANNSNITTQFLIETITITLLGGSFGIIAGIITSVLIFLGARLLNYNDWQLVISFNSILLSVGVSISIGLIFGIYPAKKASKLDPIVALQYE
jgi:putative ABC transport system permease protein